mgnify:CR=1 FL=1
MIHIKENVTNLKYIKITLDKPYEKTYQDEFRKIKKDTETDNQKFKWLE